MKIIIPTYKRADKQHTFNLLCPELQAKTTLVIRQEELEQYSKVTNNLDVLPPGEHNIATTRQYIWDKYKHEPEFAMLDDDILGFNKVKLENGKQVKDRALYPEEQLSMFETLRCMPDTVAMVSPRPSWQMPKKNLILSAALVTGFWVFNSKVLRKYDMRFDNFVWAGDADFVFQCLSLGLDTQFNGTWKYDITCNSKTYVGTEYEDFAKKYSKYIKPRKPCYGYSVSETGPSTLKMYRKRCLDDNLKSNLTTQIR